MTAPAHLPADQQAVLDLVLRRGRSYAGIARALRLDVDAVRARARDAVTTLSAPAPTVPDDRRAQVTDWLLGQAEPAAAERAQRYLIANPGARDWARTAADSLGGTASARLAGLPGGTRAARAAPAAARRSPGSSRSRSPRSPSSASRSSSATPTSRRPSRPRRAPPPRRARGSRPPVPAPRPTAPPRSSAAAARSRSS